MSEHSMVEKVARAIVAAKFGPDSVVLFEPVPDGFEKSAEAAAKFKERTDQARKEARAAIEAMREPTQVMIDAGFYPAVQNRGAKSVWPTMIDAALSEERAGE